MSVSSGDTLLSISQIPSALLGKSIDEILNLGNYKRNFPNIRFNHSIRKIAYSTVSACADIIDNSIDAKATKVQIIILTDKNNNIAGIRFVDNGYGMNYDEADQALILGSDSGKHHTDLGTFGCGLKTASLSQGRAVRVITKSEDDTFVTSAQDLDVMTELNDWIKELRKSNKDEINLFKSYLGDSTGTIVDIYKIDHCDYTDKAWLQKALLKHLGIVFRKFIKSKRVKFFVGDAKVEPIDPIHDNQPSELLDQNLEFEGHGINIKLYELNDYGQSINSQRGIGHDLQGFHVFRNNREIMNGETFGMFIKHPKFNFFRGEIYFDGNLDDYFSTDVKKSSIMLKQSIRDKIENIVRPYILMQGRKHNSKKADDKTKDVNFNPLIKLIEDKLNLIETPKTEKEKRDRNPTPSSAKPPKEESDGLRKRKPKNNKKPGFVNGVDFRFVNLGGEYGPIWNPVLEGRRVIVELNEQHPFIIEHVLPLNEKGAVDAFNGILVLLMALSNYELRLSQQTEGFDAFVKMRSDVGSGVMTILK
jgi:hypothetical protein